MCIVSRAAGAYHSGMSQVLLTAVLLLSGLGTAIPSWALCWVAPRACCRNHTAATAPSATRSCCQTTPCPEPASDTSHAGRSHGECCCHAAPAQPGKQPGAAPSDATVASIAFPAAEHVPSCTFASPAPERALIAPSLQVLLCVWRC